MVCVWYHHRVLATSARVRSIVIPYSDITGKESTFALKTSCFPLALPLARSDRFFRSRVRIERGRAESEPELLLSGSLSGPMSQNRVRSSERTNQAHQFARSLADSHVTDNKIVLQRGDTLKFGSHPRSLVETNRFIFRANKRCCQEDTNSSN